MKKLSVIIALFAVVLGLSQCRKPEVIGVNGNLNGGTNNLTVTASTDDGSKVDPGQSGGKFVLKWHEGDVLHCYAVKKSGETVTNCEHVGTLSITKGVGCVKATFGGSVSNPTFTVDENTYLRFFYIGSGEDYVNGVDLSSQTGNGGDLHNEIIAKANADYSWNEYVKEGSVEQIDNIVLEIPFSIMKLDLSYFSGQEGDLTICYVKNTNVGGTITTAVTPKGYKVSNLGDYETVEYASGSRYVITVSNPGEESYVVLMPGTEVVCRFSAGERSVSCMFNLKAGTFYASASAKDSEELGSYDNFYPIKIVDYVDLGDAGKWAKYNVGAFNGHYNYHSGIDNLTTVKRSWYGDYYAWGETEYHYKDGKAQTAGNNENDWKNGYYHGSYGFSLPYGGYQEWSDIYKWGGSTYPTLGDQRTFKKYVKTSGEATSLAPDFSGDNKLVLDDEDDVAYVKTSERMRMPLRADWFKLISNAYMVYTNNYYNMGLSGFIFYKAKTDADKGIIVKKDETPSSNYGLTDPHVFLPFAGDRSDFNYSNEGIGGNYDSATRSADGADKRVFVNINTTVGLENYYRKAGISVRPINEPKPVLP